MIRITTAWPQWPLPIPVTIHQVSGDAMQSLSKAARKDHFGFPEYFETDDTGSTCVQAICADESLTKAIVTFKIMEQ